MADLSPGAIVDNRYKVLSRLGAGGMADVFLAEDQQLGRKVALKLLHRRFSADPDFVERFRREAQAAAGLQHPNVVSVYDRGNFEDTYYIAMEYLPGRSLKQLIRQEAPLDPIRAIDITIQILKAARFAHRRGVIHRDLKPHSVINPAVPPELEQVVMWALNKNPVDRPTDADQFINALEAAKSVIQSGGGGQRTASMAALAAVGGVGAAYGSPAAGGAGVSPETAIAAYRQPAADDTGS